MTTTEPFDFVTTDGGSGITYTPWTDGYAIGFKVTHPDGRVEHLYLNPSQTDSEGTPGDTPCVFLYHDGAEIDYSATVCFVNVMEVPS